MFVIDNYNDINNRQYTISEISSMLNESIHTIRYWENVFDIQSINDGKQRIYSHDNLEEFKYIKALVNEKKYSTKEIHKLLLKREIAKEEAATTLAIDNVPNSNAVLAANMINYAINKFKDDLVAEIDQRDNELYKRVDFLTEKLLSIQDEREQKFDRFVDEWRMRNQRKSFIKRFIHWLKKLFNR